jgi:hypothetical protein
MKAEQVFEDLANRVPRIRSAREAAATVVQVRDESRNRFAGFDLIPKSRLLWTDCMMRCILPKPR